MGLRFKRVLEARIVELAPVRDIIDEDNPVELDSLPKVEAEYYINGRQSSEEEYQRAQRRSVVGFENIHKQVIGSFIEPGVGIDEGTLGYITEKKEKQYLAF